MASKTLNVQVEAYDVLAAHKRGDESFTQVILRLAKPRASLLALAGVLSGEEAEEMRKAVAQSRRMSLRRAQRQAEGWPVLE